jgi:hypothetical protein
MLGVWRYSSIHYLTSTLDGGERSASDPGLFTPRERARGTHWIGGWVGPTKVKLFLCFNRGPRHKGVLGEQRYRSMDS